MGKNYFFDVFSLPKSTKAETDALVKETTNITNVKKESIIKSKTLHLSNELPPLDFGDADKFGFVPYKGLRIKDFTTPLLEEEGITVLKVIAQKEVTVDLHAHDRQTQIITVKKGIITNCTTGMSFGCNKSLFVPMNEEHLIKYNKGTVAIIYYSPKLKTI